jgi:hypothetical protein
MATCQARIARGKVAFGNGKNYFYLEGRCGRPSAAATATCDLCSNKNPKCRTMDSRQFNHGLVSEPIPAASHIYGGEWYAKNVEIYGQPSERILELAVAAAEKSKLATAPPPEEMKKVATLSTALQPARTIRAEYIEVPNTLADVQEIIRVQIKGVLIDGQEYYEDEASGQLYMKYENGGMGPPIKRAAEAKG